jgi:4-hydroxybenzoate polyprenyltransferase
LKIIAAFFKLIRWGNLLFIAITQLLFYFSIVRPTLLIISQPTVLNFTSILLLVIAGILIAAGGNIINDYFDLNIDKINKPHKLVVDKYISRRWVIILHLIVSSMAIGIGIYLSIQTHVWWISVTNFVCVILLFFYSSTLKKKFLIGNIIVALLVAWSIMIIALIEFKAVHLFTSAYISSYRRILRLGIVYSSFAFIITIIREVIKDMEDIDGDRKYGCKTLPIVWGINATKVFVAVWLIVLIAALILLQVYASTYAWWLSIIYGVTLIIIPLVFVLKQLIPAQFAKDFNKLSSYTKAIIFAGILSMLFFYFNQ